MLGSLLVGSALFPLGAWRALNTARWVSQDGMIFLNQRDYAGALAWLNAGGLIFAGLLATTAILSLFGRGRVLRAFVLVACALIALQGLVLAGATKVVLGRRPPKTTGGWRPAAIEPGAEVVVVPTANRGLGISGGGAIAEWDERAAQETARALAGAARPGPSEGWLSSLFHRVGVEEAFDPMRSVEGAVDYAGCWCSPRSTFDAPHTKEPTSEFEMVPHLLIVRYADGRIGEGWAGEFRRIAGRHRSGSADRR